MHAHDHQGFIKYVEIFDLNTPGKKIPVEEMGQKSSEAILPCLLMSVRACFIPPMIRCLMSLI